MDCTDQMTDMDEAMARAVDIGENEVSLYLFLEDLGPKTYT